MENNITAIDLAYLGRAVELALEAEAEGNLPIGCVISFEGKIVAEGKNAIWVPEFNPTRHAEMEALLHIPRALFDNTRRLTLYTTLEPCLMCTGAILQHALGRVVFGSTDAYGGAGSVFGQMAPYFEDELSALQWMGPALPEACNPLYERVVELVQRRHKMSF